MFKLEHFYLWQSILLIGWHILNKLPHRSDFLLGMLFGFYCLVTNGINCNLSTQLSSYFFLIVRLHIGGIDTRSGNVQYVPVISADIPSTWYIHRSRLSVPACTKDLYINESTNRLGSSEHTWTQFHTLLQIHNFFWKKQPYNFWKCNIYHVTKKKFKVHLKMSWQALFCPRAVV